MNMDNLPIYYINLDKDIERKKNIELQFKNKNITRVEGVYGKALDNETLYKYTERSKKDYSRNEKMSPGEIGCLLSHIKLFKESLNNNEPYILVLEDDADMITWMNDSVKKYVNTQIHKHECIQLSVIISENDTMIKNCVSNNLINFDNPSLLDWNDYTKYNYPWFLLWSTAGYIISYEARVKLINLFESDCILYPADYFIYMHTNTKTLMPSLISYNIEMDSNINITNYNSISHKIITNYFYKKRLLLITIWFGKLPHYFNIWYETVKNMDYDVLFISDQELPKKTNNIKYIFMTFDDFNVYLNETTGFNVKLSSSYKLVDVKPLYGFLFKQFINDKYDYWGWSDIDMMMGDITKYVNESPGYDIYSFGCETFGPLMIFKSSFVDFYKEIENYEAILNDEYVCKVDEMWFFTKLGNPVHGNVYHDQQVKVRYYAGKNLLDFVKTQKIHIINFNNSCTGINWNIQQIQNRCSETWTYKFINNKLYKNGVEINHSHMSLLKNYEAFSDFFNNNYTDVESFAFKIIVMYNGENASDHSSTVVDMYNKYTNMFFQKIGL
jgi:GR25 family glycosyltransferase involved in LPS biosynthesis